MLVADGDGESAVVGPDDLDDLAGPAGDGHLLALAPVRRLVRRSSGSFACKKKKTFVLIN